MERKHFLKDVLKIAVPVGFQSMLQSSFGMVDQMMVGQLGSTAVAAVEVASRPAFIYSVVVGAVASIAGIMIAQYLGMEDQEMVDRSLSVNLAAAAALGTLFTALCLFFPREIVNIYVGNDPEILGEGETYLAWVSWTYFPMGAASVLSVFLRCTGKASWPLWAGIVSAAVNTGLNYMMIFGHSGFKAMGVEGAAAASVISQAVNFVLIFAMVYRLKAGRRERFCFSLALGKSGRRQYFSMLLPILFNEFLWSMGQNVNTMIYGHLGKGDLAAMAMTGPVQGLFIGALKGVSQAAGILIGKRLGAREYDDAYRESKALMWYGFAGAIFLSALLMGLRGPYVRLYYVEDRVREAASGLLFMFAVLAPVKVGNMILGGGIVRSGGKTVYTMVIDMAGTWLVGVPLGLITAFVFRLPVVWVYFILSQEELVRFLITLVIFKRKKWISSFAENGR